ncbi:hypothetical protein B6S12_01145 [Helicobacter valdiviensis]|uniref:HmcD domain-containing protein n=1 Tax=Helicobacter valdiviensis TaxID=1458358 RepID=A0A2W6MY41_9HELI|nr:hypothetical protein [Helicobacter valdiviensis]PZT48931.1 hypothetical protein B6S12_01145 [Helicobacter valdiviensis]
MAKRILLSLCLLLSISYASDPVTMDSLFKKQIGLRSITSISYLSSGNAYIYNMYPTLVAQPDTKTWTDTKQISLNQTFIYTLTPKFDLLVSGSGSYKQNEYVDNFSFKYSSQRSVDFDSLWIGGIYTADTIMDMFVPQITLQAGVIQQEEHFDEEKNFMFKSYSAQFSLRNYSDPVISSLYIGSVYNADRKFDYGKLEYGNSFYFGFDMSVILSPKISLDAGLEQRYQTASKFESIKTSNSYSIPTFSLGATYSLDSDTSVSISGTAGGSSSAPDSVFTFSLWKKF